MARDGWLGAPAPTQLLQCLWNLYQHCSIPYVIKFDLDPVAAILIDAHLDLLSHSNRFHEEHGQPPNAAAKAQHFRSVAQALFTSDDRYGVCPDYLELGRLEYTNLETSKRFLLRSNSAVAIEASIHQGALFNATKYIESPVTLLIYKFHKEGLDLSVSGTRKPTSSNRLESSGTPTCVGTWLFSGTTRPPFNQGTIDGFDELGGDAEEDTGE